MPTATSPVATTSADLTSYQAIHSAIRVTSHRLVAAAGRVDPADRGRVKAMRRYWKGYEGEVLLHHTVEDDIFFPALRERVPVIVPLLDQLDDEHHQLDAAMKRCATAVEALAAGQTDDLVPSLRSYASLMDHHLDLEDADILPLFQRHFDAEEFEGLHAKAMESTGMSKQLLFTVPFLGTNATPEEKAALLDQAPLPFRVMYRVTRRPHLRLARRALGGHVLSAVTK